MGTLTQSDLLGEIKAGLGNRTDIANSRLVNMLNLAQSRLCRVYDFMELQQLTVQAVSYTANSLNDKIQQLPANTKTIHSIVLVDDTGGQGSLSNSRKMIEKPWRWFDREYPVPELEAPGWPTIYTRWGSSITVFPPPNAGFHFSIRSTNWPSPFTTMNTTMQSDFDHKDDILIDLSLFRIFESMGPAMSEQADFYLKQAIASTKEAMDREDTRPDMDVSRDLPSVVTGGNYWADPFIRGVVG